MLRVIAFLPLCLMAFPASAQNTQCQWIGQVWNCEQQQRSGVDFGILQQQNPAASAMDGFERGRQLRAQADAEAARREVFEAQRQAYAAQQRASGAEIEQRALGRRAGELVAAGRCPDAEALALQSGAFDLANSIRAYCAGK